MTANDLDRQWRQVLPRMEAATRRIREQVRNLRCAGASDLPRTSPLAAGVVDASAGERRSDEVLRLPEPRSSPHRGRDGVRRVW